MKLTYKQLREILKLIINDGGVKKTFEEFLSGKSKMSVQDAANVILQSEIDVKILEILSEGLRVKSDEIDAMEAVEILVDFFQYIVSNSKKLIDMLASLGLRVKVVSDMPSPDSKVPDSQ